MEQQGEDFFRFAYRSVLEVWASARQTRDVTVALQMLERMFDGCVS